MPKLTARTISFRPGERNIFFHLLTACNLACAHCYINREQHGSGMVSKQQLEDWLSLFLAPGQENNLIFLGGEPTMHPDLAHGVKTARRLGYDSITIDSNGFLFNDILTRIAPEEAVLSFSLDGPDPLVNDPIRGQGVFATCTANLKKAKAMGFRTSLICTVSSRNLAALHRMPDLVAELGVDRFFIQVIGIRGKSAASGQSDLQLTPEQWLDAVPLAAEQAARHGITVVYPKVFLEPTDLFQCAGRVAENFFIFPNGRVYQCPLCEDLPINTFRIEAGRLLKNQGLVEEKFFSLDIPEGCVMNKLLQPGNLRYDANGKPLHRISCCLLKQELRLQD